VRGELEMKNLLIALTFSLLGYILSGCDEMSNAEMLPDGGATDALPDTLLAVKTDTLPAVKTDTLPAVKTDAQVERATSCPTLFPPKKGYIFTEGSVKCDPAHFILHPGLTCEQIMTTVTTCCVSVYGKSEKDSSLYDLASLTRVNGSWVASRTTDSLLICAGLLASRPWDTAVCTTSGKFLGWACPY
jgi:hypothetical protein